MILQATARVAIKRFLALEGARIIGVAKIKDYIGCTAGVRVIGAIRIGNICPPQLYSGNINSCALVNTATRVFYKGIHLPNI